MSEADVPSGPSALESIVKAVLDVARHGVTQHLRRKRLQQQWVRAQLMHPESAIFRRTVAPLGQSNVWGGRVSAEHHDGTRSALTRYLVYLNDGDDLTFVMLDGEDAFHHAPSDPEIFQAKWEMFHRS